MTVATEAEAVEALLEWQVSEGDVPTQPAVDATTETEAGWAFFNVNGYLGTVTPEGEVIVEADLADDE